MLTLSASVGIAIYPLHSEDEFDLVRHADVALYSAKRAGTGFAVYDANTDEYTRERLALADELRRGIEDGQLICHYQPQVCLRTGKVVGVESLVRWRHSELGLLPPADFVPLAERTGLIGALTGRVLDDGIAKARAWELRGRPLVVAVNVSVRDVLDPELPCVVGAAVSAAGLRPELLRLEITETQLLSDLDLALRNLQALARLGVRLALDDFGAGYASLGYLRRLPIDQLKIDRSLVAEMAHDNKSASIVKAALILGTDLGLEVIAEGVEDDAIRERLVALGYGLGQGYGLARPMAEAELAAWLRGRTIAST